MASAVATRKRPKRQAAKRRGPRRPPAPPPWWGVGELAPHRQFPGTTIAIPAVWSTLRDRWETHNGYYFFDTEEADRAVDFFPEMLVHHIGEFAGLPFELMGYQKVTLSRPLFGWKRASDGLRRFRKVFGFLPKGAGKSPWAAGTGLYLTCCDHEEAAEVYALAADKMQAKTVHENAKIMVEQSPDLSDICEVLRDSIYCPDSRSRYLVLSADAKTKHGFRPHGAIFDEFHAQPNRDLYEAIWRSMAKRRQPVMILISHAGDDDEGICYEEYEYAKAVLTGHVEDDTVLPVIFEARKGDRWNDPAVWPRVNPGHGITVKHDAIVVEAREAEAEPRKRNDFKRFHLNIWTNQAVAWIQVEEWDACEAPVPSDAELKTLPVACGLDLAQKWDLACFMLAFRHRLEAVAPQQVTVVEIDDTGEARVDERGEVKTKVISLNYAITLLPFFWIPEETMRMHEKEDRVPYSDWVEAGMVTATDGAVIDYTRIYHDITTKIVPRFPRIKQGGVGYDPAFATDIATQLRDRAGFKVEEVLQNFKYMSEPGYIFEALIKGRRINHGGHRVLRNHVENVAVKTDDAKRIRPVKPKKNSKHIDGVVASLMGLRMLAAVPDAKRGAGVFFV